jgi:hypothetical protein
MTESGELFRDPPRDGACTACGRLRDVFVDAGGICLDCRQIKNTWLLGQESACAPMTNDHERCAAGQTAAQNAPAAKDTPH